MKKWIVTISIVTLFIGMAFLPAGASDIAEEPEKEGPGWKYFVIGRIRNYEIVEYNGTEYLSCKAVRVRFFTWNVFEKFPRVPIMMTLRFGSVFNIPYEGVKILNSGILGRSFIVARGVL